MPAAKGKLNERRRKQGMSGLQGRRRLKARALVKRAALLGWRNRDDIHYTQGPLRWEGINQERNPFEGEYPYHADCSAFGTWLLWAVLHHHYGFQEDLVNGARWRAGFTGTMIRHGRRVKHRINWRRGDQIFYGDQGGGIPEHVATYVGNGMVVSHGSEGGPYLIRWNYRSDFNQCRRYV